MNGRDRRAWWFFIACVCVLVGGAIVEDLRRAHVLAVQLREQQRREMSCYLAASIALTTPRIMDPGFSERWHAACNPDSLAVR